MDPLTLIVTALAAGAAKIGGEAAVDAYHALLKQARRLFAHDTLGLSLLEKHAQAAETSDDPSTANPWETSLQAQLADAGATNDRALIAAAEGYLAASRADSRTPQYVNVVGARLKIGSKATVYAEGDIGSTNVTLR